MSHPVDFDSISWQEPAEGARLLTFQKHDPADQIVEFSEVY